jgi:hypothetical protein
MEDIPITGDLFMDATITLEDISGQTRDALMLTESTIDQIAQINLKMNILGLNARVEAARVGPLGTGFALVADEVRHVSSEINGIATGLGQQLGARLKEVTQMVQDMSTSATGTRLVDLAFTAIDLIDRNLYERSCDVRWWATDADLVAAASGGDVAQAGRRLGVILDAYTVYSDIWLCDLGGQVLCNARPEKFAVTGAQVAHSPWFAPAKQLTDGDGFVAGPIEVSALLGGRETMAWATLIRTGGARHGAPVGMLITQFDWAPQAAAVLASLRFADGAMCAMLTDDAGHVLAHRGTGAPAKLSLPAKAAGWHKTETGMLGFHRTEGFETWRGKGWHGVVMA